MPSIDLRGPYRKVAWAEKRGIALQSEIDAVLSPSDGSDAVTLGHEFNAHEAIITQARGLGSAREGPHGLGPMGR